MTATDIRRATDNDVPALAATLAAAFHDYPWTRWAVDERDHGRRLRGIYAIYLSVAVRFGEVWMAVDAAGAAAWTWSANNAAQAEELASAGLDARVAKLAGARAENAGFGEQLLEPHALREPHWQLAAIGVHPSRQGQGLGTRLLAPMLDHCDRCGQMAALETSSPDNVRLYERNGFAVHAEVAVPDGPHVWVMRRAPRSA